MTKPESIVNPARDGWHYRGEPRDGTNARKIVTLVDGAVCWVGIRAWNASQRRWENNGEPEPNKILAWRDLHEPAKGYWYRGQLFFSEDQT